MKLKQGIFINNSSSESPWKYLLLFQMVKLLLSRGANINAFDKKDRRAIHWAAYMGMYFLNWLLTIYLGEIMHFGFGIYAIFLKYND